MIIVVSARLSQALTLSLLCVATSAIGQDPTATGVSTLTAGGITFTFASVQQGQDALRQRDSFVSQLSPFDRQVRMHTTEDRGEDAFVEFVAGEVIAWPESLRATVQRALEELDAPLKSLQLPDVGTVQLVHTTGREESGAAYTRGTTIVLPKAPIGSPDKPPVRLLAHELFHVLSRGDAEWRDRLYAIIGFKPTGEISLSETFENRRITNPDAPVIEHGIEVKLEEGRKVTVVPALFAKSKFTPAQRSLFSYLEFKLLQVSQNADQRWTASGAGDEPVFHAPSIPDYHRQIGRNTGYIIHPEEILADNFAALVTGAKVKDQWLIDGMRKSMSR